MRLDDTRGCSLELRILGYQFPDLETEKYDSNWLVVEGNVSHPRGDWTFRDPCLLTYEASRLAGWLDSLARGAPSSRQVGFVEPNLLFRSRRQPAGASLRVYFELEARPPWAPFEAVDGECWIDFPVSEFPLRRAAASLRNQLKSYPQRAAR